MSEPMTTATPVAPSCLRQRLLAWSKQPSTQQGLSLLLGGCALALLQPFTAAEGIAATLVAASLPKLWPDNTTDAIRVGALSNALVHAVVTRRVTDLEAAAAEAASFVKPVGAAA